MTNVKFNNLKQFELILESVFVLTHITQRNLILESVILNHEFRILNKYVYSLLTPHGNIHVNDTTIRRRNYDDTNMKIYGRICQK